MKRKKNSLSNILLHLFFLLFSLLFIFPLLLIVSVSFSAEKDIMQYGYSLIPKNFDLTAYRYVFANPKQVIDSYKITIFNSVVGTGLNMLVMSLIAYTLSHRNYPYRRILTYFVFFTALFSGGLIPQYILNTQVWRLGNSRWIYIFPSLANAFHIIIIRTFFQELPGSLTESAKIDGAGEFRIFFRIVLPLSKPVMATIALLTLLVKWNDWYTSLIYIRDAELYTLQYMLQRILREAEFINKISRNMPAGIDISQISGDMPTEGMRFAMCIVAAGPMLVVFPFFQKYFTRGLTIGAVKG
jgi:putative aldouronate transport system permease protein